MFGTGEQARRETLENAPHAARGADKNNGRFDMDSLDLIRTFREVASQGSFSHAAKRLHMSKATVSKYVAELETRFGVRLLNRAVAARAQHAGA